MKEGKPIQGCQVAWDQRCQILLEKLPKVAKQVFLTMTQQNSPACVLRPEVSYSCPRIKIGSVDRDIKNHFSIAK